MEPFDNPVEDNIRRLTHLIFALKLEPIPVITTFFCAGYIHVFFGYIRLVPLRAILTFAFQSFYKTSIEVEMI